MPSLPITDSCPTCQICGHKCHRMASHIKIVHKISKDEYLKMYPNSKMNSDERIYNQNEFNKKMTIIQQNNQKLYGDKINQKISKSQLKRFQNLSEEKRKNLSLKAIQRNIFRRNNKILDRKFKNKCSEASLKYWNNISSDRKQERIAYLIDCWKTWYNSLSNEEQKYYRRNSLNKKQKFNFTILGNNKYKFKSKLEKFVAEFLYINNIKFEYENLTINYIHDNIIKKHIPDFYLPKFNIILECKAFYKRYTNDSIEKQIEKQKDKEISISLYGYKYILILHNRNVLSVLENLYYILDNELKI